MSYRSRRQFLADVGQGMLVASVGYHLALDMGFVSKAYADETPPTLSFGALEPLVCLMQETPVDRLLPAMVDQINGGTDLKTLVTAAALANARSFGGEDYIGFHTLMALAPAYHMSAELSGPRQALPIFKVLYRNTSRLNDTGGRANEVLGLTQPAEVEAGAVPGEALRALVRQQDVGGAENLFAGIAQGTPDEAFNALLYCVQDNTEVHRVALPYRAWDLLGMIGPEHAHTLLRQSVRYCLKNCKHDDLTLREQLASLMDGYKLAGRACGTREVDDAWVAETCDAMIHSTPQQAAERAAAVLAEGISPDALGEAIALAANQLVLRDNGRPEKYANDLKPPGSVHGDSIGVHACDAINAWRNMAKAANARNRMASLIVAAYEVSRDAMVPNWGTDFVTAPARPFPADMEAVQGVDPAKLLAETEDAIRHNDQAKACASIARYGELGGESRPVFDLMLKYAISEDGALHAEKYYRTVSEEFAVMRPAFRWRQLAGLARVTASEFGRTAAGYEQACGLLKV